MNVKDIKSKQIRHFRDICKQCDMQTFANNAICWSAGPATLSVNIFVAFEWWKYANSTSLDSFQPQYISMPITVSADIVLFSNVCCNAWKKNKQIKPNIVVEQTEIANNWINWRAKNILFLSFRPPKINSDRNHPNRIQLFALNIDTFKWNTKSWLQEKKTAFWYTNLK